MNIIKASVEFLDAPEYEQVIKKIERIGRVCYRSEDKITEDSAERFVRGIIKSGHESVIEHQSLSVKVICDRGVSHEIVRHRIASYSQESTRYCNYTGDKFGGEVSFIDIASGFGYGKGKLENSVKRMIWQDAMRSAEYYYNEMIDEAIAEAKDFL